MSGIWRCTILAAALAACTVYNTPGVREVARPGPSDSALVATPVKAHLLDGSTIVFPAGIKVLRGTIYSAKAGVATFRYGLTLRDSAAAVAIPLDSVAGLEAFSNSVNSAASFGLTILGTAATVVGAAVLAIAIFGSCPTVYTDSAGTPALEAEGFSYSIAPLFEARDVDRLARGPDSIGILRLEVRNEALETHYINQMAVLQVVRGRDETVVPEPRGAAFAVGDLLPPVTATDRAGRDVRDEIARQDGRMFATAPAILDRVTAGDADDAIALTFPRPVADTVALVFRVRNSLLNTVLLYDVMLKDAGLRSLDWIGHDLQRIDAATQLGQWYARNFGMHIAVQEGDTLHEIGRVPDTGPIAWKDVAILVAVPRDADSLRVHLTFLADDWRIDHIGLARHWRRLTARTLTAVAVTDSSGRTDTSALSSLQAADEHYLVTQPGDRFFLRFASERVPADSVSAFLLASQGYYIEWLRGSWVRQQLAGTTFRPTEEALVEALQRWRRQAPDLERRFYASRLPVR